MTSFDPHRVGAIITDTIAQWRKDVKTFSANGRESDHYDALVTLLVTVLGWGSGEVLVIGGESPDLAKAAEKMFAKMDEEDKDTFNEFIFMARGYGPKALAEARESIRLLVRIVDIEPGSETDLCGIHDCTCSLTHPFQLPATIVAMAERGKP